MLSYCDYCRNLIIPTDMQRGDEDEVWEKELDRRRSLQLSKMKGIKRFFSGVFNNPQMPFYPNLEFTFCSKGCYDCWKEKARFIFANQGEEK